MSYPINHKRYRPCLHIACVSCGALSGKLCITRKGEPAQIPHKPREEGETNPGTKVIRTQPRSQPSLPKLEQKRLKRGLAAARLEELEQYPLAVEYGWCPRDFEGVRKPTRVLFEEVEEARLKIRSVA